MNENLKPARKPFGKLPHNARVEKFLADNGLPGVMAKWLSDGSLKGQFILIGYHRNARGQRDQYRPLKWTSDFADKMNALGFRDFDGTPLTLWSGNGGEFSLCVIPPAGLDPRYVVEVA